MFLKILSIVTEYNPFHNGHKYHLRKSLELTGCTHTLAIMSGNFLQRGEPSLMDKWTRAKSAVQNGIDLVIELPFVYSCQSADVFAYGSILHLNQLKGVDYISFGCENNNLDSLITIKNIIKDEPMEYKISLKKYLDSGLSFPKARELALSYLLKGEEKIISSPNNILALSYLKWLDLFNSTIKPIPVKRQHAGYHDLEAVENIASATMIRNTLGLTNNSQDIKDYVTNDTYQIMSNYEQYHAFNKFANYFTLIKSNLLRASRDELINYFDINEGLENRIINVFGKSKSMDELIERIITKRYTSTRIKRVLVNHLLNHSKINHYNVYKNPLYTPYIRILAFNEKGKDMINLFKKDSMAPIITNVSKSYSDLTQLQKYVMDKDILATDYYYLPIEPSSYHMDYLKKPEIIK